MCSKRGRLGWQLHVLDPASGPTKLIWVGIRELCRVEGG